MVGKRGEIPLLFFNTNDYISFRPDILNADICPLVHYELFGKKEFLSFCFDKIKVFEKKISDLYNKTSNLDNNIARDKLNFETFKKNVLFTYKKGINKEKVSYEIENFFDSSEFGIIDKKQKQELIISLTSYIGRMYDIHYTIYSLFK